MIRRIATVALTAALVFTSAGCSGGDKVSDGRSPDEVMTLAKKTLDDTSGLKLRLATTNLPNGVNGIEAATGVATHQPAFDGTVKVKAAGTPVEVPLVAVDGKVFAELPFSSGFQEIDPGDFGAPDPAALLGDEAGFSGLLTQTDGLKEGKTERGGTNNDEVLTAYTGTIPGAAMKAVIPSTAGASFDVRYLITAEGELRRAEYTGQFYPDSAEMTYAVDFTDYGTEKDITAP